MNKSYLEQLDVFRAIAALSVCAVHFSYDTIFHIYFKQALFVQFFFTLSGFVIYLNYHDQEFNLFKIKNFMIKRFFRLYPLHFFFLIIFSSIELLKYFLSINYDFVFNREPFLLNNFSNFFLHLFFLQHYADKYSFNGPAWSISVEMFLYFSFAILFFVNKKKYFLVIPTIFTILFLLFLNDIYGAGYSHGAFFSGFYSFSLGCIFCKIYLKNKKLFKSRLYNVIYFILLALFFVELFGYKILFKSSYAFIYSIFFGLVIYLSCFLNKNFLLYKLFFNNWFIYLGKISYSIYLGHVLVFYFMNNFLKYIIYPLMNTSDYDYVLKLSVFEAHVFTLVAYFLTIILATLTYRYIETKYYKKI
jgi:peptidoglycan/LPS O-acetylase OafA/YrhL